MKDKMIAGALAGITGAIAQNIYGYLIKVSGLSDRGFIDFAGAVIFYKFIEGTGETVLAIIALIIWDLLLGILFAYFRKGTSLYYYYSKALIYGLAVWFVVQVLGTMFRLPVFFRISARAALFALIGAIIYGLVVAFVIKTLEKNPPTG